MTDHEPTVPLIVYLHADRLIPKHPHLGDGTRVPCSDHVVETQALATLLFASAFWSLRRAGLIAMEIAADANGKGSEVILTTLGDEVRPGLEGAIMAVLEGSDALPEVVFRWSAAHSTDPWHDGVHEVVAEAVSAGYLREAPASRGVLARLISRGSDLEPDCGRIGELRGRYDWFVREWDGFRAREGLFHETLMERSGRALQACSECWYP